MFYPRQDVVYVDSSDQNHNMQISPMTKFRRNPLAVIIETEPIAEEEASDEEDEEEEGESVDGEEEEEEEDGEDESLSDFIVSDSEVIHSEESNGSESSQSSEASQSKSSEDIEDESSETESKEPKVHYLIHINFGNEKLTSAVRIRLVMSAELATLMEWIRKKRTFSMEDLTNLAQGVSEHKIIRLLRVLCFNGAIRVKS